MPVFCLFSVYSQLAGGFDEIIVGLGYSAEMVKREISAGQRAELLGMPRNSNGDLTKAAASHSRRLAHASRSMARSMLGQRNSMVVSCPCSPGVQFTVYGAVHTGSEWPLFEVQCHQGCGANFQSWRPVHVGSSGGVHTAFLDQVEVGKAVSPKGGFTCIKIGAWDDATAAKLAEQKVRVSLHTLTLHHALHTMAYTSSSLRAENESAG